MVYRHLSDLDFSLDALPAMRHPENVLMTSPDHFDVTYVINAHMAGKVGTVDTARARSQWSDLKDAYVTCGLSVTEIQDRSDLPDMVFCANQALPFLREDGTRGVLLSKMYAAERAGEVTYFGDHFGALGYEIVDDIANGELEFEGMGDALWHSGRRLLWGGYGFRTEESVYRLISEKLDVPILLLGLKDPEFYHLDTCLCILDEKTALIYPAAFEPGGLELVRHFFPRIIEAPEVEARELFACNAHSPDGKNVIIQRGCTDTKSALTEAGFNVTEIDTDEFLKSGGSVFCMKLMTW